MRNRIKYLKYKRGYRRYVIVDFDEQGQAHFADQEDGGQWYEYIPSEIERQMALQIAANGQRTGGWAVFIEMTDGA